MELNNLLSTCEDHEQVLMQNCTSATGTSILALPDELLIHILQFLPFKLALNVTSCLCKKFYELSKDPKLIPKSFTLPLFRSSCLEKNDQCREQMMDIVARASLLKTLSMEVSINCHLNNELQLIGSGRCKVKIDMTLYSREHILGNYRFANNGGCKLLGLYRVILS